MACPLKTCDLCKFIKICHANIISKEGALTDVNMRPKFVTKNATPKFYCLTCHTICIIQFRFFDCVPKKQSIYMWNIRVWESWPWVL
jgi:hypothetical protein